MVFNCGDSTGTFLGGDTTGIGRIIHTAPFLFIQRIGSSGSYAAIAFLQTSIASGTGHTARLLTHVQALLQ